MKRATNTVIVAALLISASADAATIPDTAAASYVGQTITLDCNAVSVFTSRGGNTFVNCGAPYPRQNASIVEFGGTSVGNLHQYEGKHLLVHGVVRLYKGKPEIILVSTAQIEGTR